MGTDYPRGLDKVKRLGLGLTKDIPGCLNLGMAEDHTSPSNIDAISWRLMLTRLAIGRVEGTKLKKSEFADRAGISRTAYSNWEPREGKQAVGRPSVDEANKLCNAYDLTMDWIYRGHRKRLPHELVEAIEAVERDIAQSKRSPKRA